jgi:hypothetical protein
MGTPTSAEEFARSSGAREALSSHNWDRDVDAVLDEEFGRQILGSLECRFPLRCGEDEKKRLVNRHGGLCERTLI